MRLGILGPLKVSAGSTDVALAPRERILLATLLLQFNRTISVHRLVDAIWGDRPPQNAVGQVHGTVSRLRKQLTLAGAPGSIVVTDPAGYHAAVDPQSLDLVEFRQLRDQARAAAAHEKPEQARTHYRAALDLWRGPTLDGIDSDMIRQAAAALDQEHHQALEERIEVELSLGAAGELVAELSDLVRQHPYQEGLHGKLMLALHRAGRQADALAAYRNLRTILHDELGTDPGPELQHLHQAILNRDPALDRPQRQMEAQPSGTGQTRIPRELPADVAGFTGRADALEELDSLLSAPLAEGSAAPVVISAIAGTAGIGKTALAVHWAHRAVDRFPDGQLYVNLRGYAPGQPVSPSDALARFLSGLGVADPDIPLELEDRAARYRSEIAGRRTLVVLDNAATAEQVRPLLPGSGSCTVVVTSRDSLAGLVALDGAQRLDLDLLPQDDAIALLRRLIGARVDTEPEAAIALAELCVRLPLALRVAAELAASRATVPLADLVVELSDRQRRLELLDAGDDPHTAVRVVFSWSIRHLPSEIARLFRLLGLHQGPDFDSYATAALADTSVESARRGLELFRRAHLIFRTGASRYGLHDLLRAYARQLANEHESYIDRHAALTRLFDYYLATAAASMDSWDPATRARRPRIPAPDTPVPAVADADTARAWLDAERYCLVAAAHAASHVSPAHTIRLSATLHRYLASGRYADALAIHGHANAAARAARDRTGQSHALRYRGVTYAMMGQYGPAAKDLHQAFTLFHAAGDLAGEAMTLDNLGGIEERLGHSESAMELHQRALVLFRRVGDLTGEANTLGNLGVVADHLGDDESAGRYYQQGLALFQRTGDMAGEALALRNLGGVEERLGRYGLAADHLQQSLVLFRQLRHSPGEAGALESLGNVHIRLGRPGHASKHLNEALRHFREIGDRNGEALALNGLGHAARCSGRISDALLHHREALTVADDINTNDQRARAHAGLGFAYHALGDHTNARDQYEQALGLYLDVRTHEAEEVRVRLGKLTNPPSQGPAPDDVASGAGQ